MTYNVLKIQIIIVHLFLICRPWEIAFIYFYLEIKFHGESTEQDTFAELTKIYNECSERHFENIEKMVLQSETMK